MRGKRLNKLLAMFLSLVMLLGLLPAAALAASTDEFSDFPASSHWAHDALSAAVDNGLLKGNDGKLMPEGVLTRAQLAAVINRAFGATEKANISGFSDVASTAWYAEDIAKAVHMGTFTGNGAGLMRPDDAVTRQEAFAVLARAFHLDSGSASDLAAFTDSGSVGTWAVSSVAAMVNAGYVAGNGKLLNPLSTITRQEFAQVMYRMVSGYYSAANTYTSVVTGNLMVNTSGVTLKGVTVHGDLIIADGVGSGGVTLDGVTVMGRIVVRGGGESALNMINKSSVAGKIVVAKTGAGITADDGSTLAQVSVNANNVTVTAKSGTVTAGAGVTGTKVNGEALSAGQSLEITATSTGGGGGGGTPPVTVVPTTTLTLKAQGKALTVGSGYDDAITVSRNAGANDTLSWASDNESAVKVDATGHLSAVGVGSAVISAESQSGVVGSTTIYVVNPSDKTYTITEPGTVLENCSFTKLTIAKSVGAGEVTLRNVTADELVILGGGKNTVALIDGSYGAVDVNGTPAEGTRILASGSAVLGEVKVGSGATGGVTVETASGSTASIGGISAAAALEVKNVSTPGITASGNLTVTNSTVAEVKTTGTASPTVTLMDSTVNKLDAGAGSTTLTGNSGVSKINASGAVTTGANTPVGTIAATGSANITANGAVGSVTGTAGNVSLNNSGSTAVTASADSVSVSGESKPTVSGAVTSVTVAANSEGTSGVTVTGATTNITTTGNGSVGEISIGGSANPAVNTGSTVALVSVSDTAGATVTGSATVLNTSSGTVTKNTTAIEKVEPVLQYIAVTSLPAKTEYTTTDSALDPAGLVVTGYYTVPGFDGIISKAINVTSGMLSGFSAVAGTHEITVAQEGKTAKFNVTVVAKTLDRIAITTMPSQTTYDKVNANLSLSTTGIVVKAYYTSALYDPEVITGQYSAVDFSTVGAKTVTVTYGGKTAAFTVNVINSAADAFALAQSNAKAEFLAYASDKLIDNTYSETGKAAMKKARDAGVAAIGALTYPTNVTAAITTALTTQKTNINNILTQDGEWTRDANSFKSAHRDTLAKTAANVLISDKANVSAALSAYNALETGVRNKLTAEKALLDSLLAKISAIEAAQTIDAAKQSAKATLTSALTGYNSGYSESFSAIQSAKTAGDTAITNATTVAGVTTALDAALANMASFKSDAQILTDAKTTAINTINTYLPGSMAQEAYNTAYNATGKAQVSELRAAGVEAISTAATTAAVTAALNAAKTSINGVKTAAEMAAEALDAAKSAARDELNAYGNAENYRKAQKAELTNARSTGCTAIDAAATTAAVTTSLKAAKAAIDGIKTDAQLTASELAAAKTTAKAELNGYYPTGKAEADYSATGNSLITAMRSAGCTAIDAAADTSAVTAALTAAKTSIDGVKDISGENTDAVAAAKTAAEAATYATVPQASYATEAALAAYVKGIAETAVGTDVTVTVARTDYIEPVAGTLADLDGTAGSYSFTLTLTKGDTRATTTAKTVTITATSYSTNPAVAVTPTSVSVAYMEGTTLTAVASDILNPTYQWYKGSTAIEGATNATLTLTSLTATATYYCMCSTVKSNEVTVTVAAQGSSAAPTAVITGMADSYTLPHSDSITLIVATADTYAYKWESKTGSGEWTQVGTGATLGIADLAIGMNGTQYRCTVTNTEANKLPASATSEIFTLNIQKGTQAAPTTPVAVRASFGASDGKITGVTTAMEYKLSTATVYTACAGTEITGLAAGTYNVRYAETATLSASPAAVVTVTNAGAPIMVSGEGYADLADALTAAKALKQETVEIGGEQVTYTPYEPVEIVGSYTIAAGTTIQVPQGHKVIVRDGGSLTNLGTLKLHKSSMNYAMFDSGELQIQKGGSYIDGSFTIGDSGVLKLLDRVMDSEDSAKVAVEQGEIWITGAPKDAANGNDYALPFIFLNGNIEAPADKTCTVADTDCMTFIANGDLTVNGTLTSTAFNEVRGGITVENGGSLTLNNASQLASGPWYAIGDENEAHSMGGTVYVEYGGSYTVGETKLIGTSGAKLTMTSGDAMICGQPADGGENPFVFLFDDATAANSNWESYHFIVDAYTDNGTTHTATLTIPAGVTVTLGSNEIRGDLVNSGNLTAINGLNVGGSVTNNSGATIENKDALLFYGSAGLNNAGTINGVWHSNNNPDDVKDGWWDTAIIVDYGTTTLTNTGTINDNVNVCAYVGDGTNGDPDKIPTVTGTISDRYDVAYVKTTAALKRAITNSDYEEYQAVGDFTLDADVTIPENHRLRAPGSWFEDGVEQACSFTVASGVTLTNNGSLDFWGNTTVNGTIVNKQAENAHLIIGSDGENGKTFTLNGALTNNGYMELDGQNGKSTFTIASSATLTNADHMNIHGCLLTNNGSLINNGSAEAEFGYKADGVMEVGITGTAPTGTGYVDGTAYVSNGAGLSAAAGNTNVSAITLSSDSGAVTVTLTDNVIVRQGVTLRVTQDLNEETGALTSYELVVPSGKTLTVNGELMLKGKLTIESGGTVNGTGTLTKHDSGEIVGITSLTPTVVKTVKTQEEFKAALEDTSIGEIVLTDDNTVTAYTLTNITVSRDLAITSEYNGDWDNANIISLSVSDLTIEAGNTLQMGFVAVTYTGVNTINGTLDSGPGESVNRGTMNVSGTLSGGMSNFYNESAITVNNGGNIIVERGREFENRDGASTQAVLTIENGATMTVASADNSQSGRFRNTNGAELVNKGTITAYSILDSNGGTVNNSGIINAYDGFGIGGQDFTNPGTLNNHQKANLADVARKLVEVLDGRLDGLTQPTEADYEAYKATYSDWIDFWNNDDDPNNDDSEGEYAVALLLKNGIITRSDTVRQYETMSRTEIKALLEALATKLGKTVTVTENIMSPLDGDTPVNSGTIGETGNNVGTGDVTGNNELQSICEAFREALGMSSSENVTSQEALASALAKSYVTEIHITENMSIIGAKDNTSDENNSFYLGGVENGDRRIYIDAGATLTVGDGTDHTKLDVNQGVELIINGHLTIANNSGMNVFGGLQPNEWNTLVSQGESTYINFFPDVMDFGLRLAEKVGTRLADASVEQTTIDAANEWPSSDGRIAGFEFLVAYGGLTYKTEQDNYKHWTPYEKLEYGTAISALTNVYKAIVATATALPGTVKLDGYQNDYLVNDGDLNALLEKFADELPALPKAEDNTASFTVGGTEQLYSDKNYTNSVTISYSGTPDANGWGGEIKFENCTFATGVTVNYSDSARFAVNFSDSCTVTDGVSVVPNNSTTLWKNNNVEVRGAKGLAVTATAPTSISCGSGQSFTLNGVVVSGTYGNTQDENWFNANIRYNCDAEHAETFDWSNGGDHSACKMAEGETAATISPEFQLNTGTDGTITASNTTALEMNVRVEGTADISGLTVAQDYEITVSDYNRAASVNIGANTVYIYDNGDNGYAITGTTGTATVRGQIFGNVSRITLETVNLGTPHVFGDSASGYQIFVGYPSTGNTGDVSFTVKQGDTVLTHAIDDQYLRSDGKLHLTKSGENVWITDPGNVTLTVTTDGVTAVYEPLAFKQTVAATIGEARYETLADALGAAATGETVTLEMDLDTGVTKFTISDKDITLDLNGKTVTTTADPFLTVAAGAKLTITDNSSGTPGSLYEKRDYSFLILNKGTLTIEKGSFKAESIELYPGKTEMSGTYALAMSSGSTTTVKDGTFTGLVYTNGTSENISITFDGGTFNDMLYLAAKTVSVTINGGTFMKGVETKGSTFNITGGTFYPDSTKDIATDHVPNGDGSSTNGAWAFVVVDNAGYGTVNATISGGTFNGPVALLDDDADTTNNSDTISITGGTFSSDPTAYVPSEGYMVTDNNDGTWAVSVS